MTALAEPATAAGPLPQRVLVVAPQPFLVDRGTPIAVNFVVEALSALGVAVDLLTFPMGRDISVTGVRVIRAANPLGIRHVPVGLSAQKLAIDVALGQRLRQLLRRERYDVVHAVEEAAYMVGLLCRNRPPLIYDMASSLPQQLAQSRGLGATPLQRFARRLETRLLERAAFVVCSAGLAAMVRRAAPAVPHAEWCFPAAAPDVAPAAVAALRAELALPATAPVVLYAGNFAEYQGVDRLLAAWPMVIDRIPAATAVLVGAADAHEAAQLLDRLPEPARARTRVLPRQPRARVAAFTALADVLVSPRSFGDNFPLKLFDYLAAGKPIVATDLPAHRCVLDDSLALLVPATAEGLADGIGRLLEDRAAATRLAEAAAAFARTTLSWPAFVARIEAMYRTAMARTPRLAVAAGGP